MIAETLQSVGQISRRLGVPTHRVLYILMSRHIQPAATIAGGVRVFGEREIALIEIGLRETSQAAVSHRAGFETR